MSEYIRQAVVVIHGMGEQRPLSTVIGFIDNALDPAPGTGSTRTYYSRPESVTGSYESRRFLAPARSVTGRDGEVEVNAHTEFFEYHWSHLMQGNRLADLTDTVRRILVLPITRVPYGLVWAWLLLWAAALASLWALVWGPWSSVLAGGGEGDLVTRLLGTVLSGGAIAAVVTFVVGKVLPGWLTTSFVDVVRYLDTSPRSYAVRREIRQGLVELLQRLHDARLRDGPRYDRIIVVAHSLGSYLAYDAISYLWAQGNAKNAGARAPEQFRGLADLEEAASALPDQGYRPGVLPVLEDGALEAFRDAQRAAWIGLREQGNPWRITDLITAGSPMYFADRLIRAKGKLAFRERVLRGEQPTCPPQNELEEGNRIHGTRRFFTWARGSRRVLHEGAPFAVVRWTNLYYPARLGFFGDWFGGPLAPLYGTGIKDVMVTGNGPRGIEARPWRNRLVPGFAHSLYFSFPDDDAPASAATILREALDLAASGWVPSAGELERSLAPDARKRARSRTRTPAGVDKDGARKDRADKAGEEKAGDGRGPAGTDTQEPELSGSPA
ncbi:hypothetical protein [Ornithinicoccus hortensis]|uniref:Alpha/beta hydrolase family protein n=1 Tax=Ornithinicoccus hortensis TaxID=82346 RepID=A0A542YQN3_9MICO|nr:hypothetical protein [Ornithinicoccus hortensis]TQL50415.1 hypothetical protein FB467_1523 [Ornithinicoccus hortensis]